MKGRYRKLLLLAAAITAGALGLSPMVYDSIQRTKQNRALEEMSTHSDRPPEADQLPTLYTSAAMFYTPNVPAEDPWGNPYEITWGKSPSGAEVLQIRCFGRDGKEGPTRPPYTTAAFTVTAYDEDIVWADGFFVRYPAGARVDE